MLKPIGFWSYSGSDDDADSGRLSQLRTLVKKELQLKVGREPVNIFQDVSAIPPGSKWERKIQDSIDDSSFLIPIITPAFLQSDWCYRETTLFIERQVKLGRDDLIFPLHYIDVDIIEPADCHGDLVELLKAHQWSDFRELRFKNPEGEDVRRMLADLASAVRDALRREVRVPSRAASPRANPEEEWSASSPQQTGYYQPDASPPPGRVRRRRFRKRSWNHRSNHARPAIGRRARRRTGRSSSTSRAARDWYACRAAAF